MIDRQLVLERIKYLRPIDDDFMRCMFRDNIALAQVTLRLITGIDDLVVTELFPQRDEKHILARSVILDALCRDSLNRVYDIEVQRADSGAGKKRARYHSSVIDVDNLSAGQDFDELPDSFTIFITENDVVGRGLPVYRIDRRFEDNGELFGDGSHILYVNGAYTGSDGIGMLMHDFRCAVPDEMYIKEFRDTAKMLKETKEGAETMCKLFEDLAMEIAEKHAYEQKIEFAKRMIEDGELNVEKISEYLQLPVSTVRELAEKKSA